MTGASFELHLARRYLKSTRKDAFTSFLSAVAAGGIGLGVAALVVALAALEGMQHALREQILSRTPSLSIALPPGVDPHQVDRTLGALGPDAGIVAVQRVVEGRGWLLAGGRAQSLRLMGYQGAPPRTLPGAGERPGLYLPDRMAAQAGLAIGDIATLASPRPGLTPFGPQPRLLSARIEGVYQQGRGDDEPVAALPLERAELLFGTARVGSLFVTTSDLDQALSLAQRLRMPGALPDGATVETWRELNRPLFLALALERTGLFAAVSLIVAVAAIALFSDLQLVAASKQRELALLSAMGAGEPALRRAFVLLGLFLGGGGAIVGGVVGGVAAWALDRWQLVQLPAGLLLFDSLPLRLRWLDVGAVVSITLLLTLFCAVLGSRRAARLVPAEVLRG